MQKPRFPHKPAAPSVRTTIGAAIARSRSIADEDRPLTRREVVEDLLDKLTLPKVLRDDLKKRHGLDE